MQSSASDAETEVLVQASFASWSSPDAESGKQRVADALAEAAAQVTEAQAGLDEEPSAQAHPSQLRTLLSTLLRLYSEAQASGATASEPASTPVTADEIGEVIAFSIISSSSAVEEKEDADGEQSEPPLTLQQEILLDAIWTLDAEWDLLANEGISLQQPASTLTARPSKEELAKQKTLRQEALASVVRYLLLNEHLPAVQTAARLDDQLVARCGLLPNVPSGSTDAAALAAAVKAWGNARVRMNTAKLYKQQKFNLLREESEGFSKVFEVVLGGMGPPLVGRYDEAPAPPSAKSEEPTPLLLSEPVDVHVVEQEPAAVRDRRARSVWRQLLALIGYFDLETNRVLDLVLDLFVANVSRHWPFFVALLEASPWGGAGSKAAAAGSAGGNAAEKKGEHRVKQMSVVNTV